MLSKLRGRCWQAAGDETQPRRSPASLDVRHHHLALDRPGGDLARPPAGSRKESRSRLRDLLPPYAAIVQSVALQTCCKPRKNSIRDIESSRAWICAFAEQGLVCTVRRELPERRIGEYIDKGRYTTSYWKEKKLRETGRNVTSDK